LVRSSVFPKIGELTNKLSEKAESTSSFVCFGLSWFLSIFTQADLKWISESMGGFGTSWNILEYWNMWEHFGTSWNMLEHFGTIWNILIWHFLGHLQSSKAKA